MRETQLCSAFMEKFLYVRIPPKQQEVFKCTRILQAKENVRFVISIPDEMTVDNLFENGWPKKVICFPYRAPWNSINSFY